jgi:hypothetical protein
MRKIALIITLLCIISGVYAQKVQMGLKFNPNLGWFKVDNKTNIENNGLGIGFSYGLIIDYHFLENVALCIEPAHLFYNPSSKGTDTSTTFSDNVKWKIQYIEIPLSLKMMTNQIGKFKYFGKIGISTSIKTTAKLEDKKTTSSVGLFDFALLIGGGIHYSLGGNTALLLGATFHNGLASINKDKPFAVLNGSVIQNLPLTDVKLKSSFVTLDIGILF